MSKLKLYSVKIDNDPGGWKSGQDQSVLVVAHNTQEAIQRVKNGWGSSFGWDINKTVSTITYSQKGEHKPYILEGAILSVQEVYFDIGDNLKVEIVDVMQKKLNKIKK